MKAASVRGVLVSRDFAGGPLVGRGRAGLGALMWPDYQSDRIDIDTTPEFPAAGEAFTPAELEERIGRLSERAMSRRPLFDDRRPVVALGPRPAAMGVDLSRRMLVWVRDRAERQESALAYRRGSDRRATEAELIWLYGLAVYLARRIGRGRVAAE